MAVAAKSMTPHGQPTVSVCIANYNGMAIIDACLHSVLQQDCKFTVEVIVHDDASTDNSAAHIRNHYPGVILIESDENVGFCIANNRMAQAAHGEYLLLLNNDAELFPDALRTLYEAALAIGQAAVLGLPQYDASNGALIDRGSLFDPFLNPVPNLDVLHTDVGMNIGACLWVPSNLWQQIGGFPPWFHTLAEDMYFCCVARLWGYPVKVLPQSGFRHWVGKSLGGGKVTNSRLATTIRRRALSERNKSYVMALTYPAPFFQILFPLHLFLLAIEGLILSLIKRDARLWRDIYLNCFRALLREWRFILKSRQYLQTCRRVSLMEFISIFQFIPHKLQLLLKYGVPAVR
jgi:GT2 family glycosyltransferase